MTGFIAGITALSFIIMALLLFSYLRHVSELKNFQKKALQATSRGDTAEEEQMKQNVDSAYKGFQISAAIIGAGFITLLIIYTIQEYLP